MFDSLEEGNCRLSRVSNDTVAKIQSQKLQADFRGNN